jgi:NAD-dependent SIR2 family protein deacetylase
MKTIFILGAGASKEAGGPLMNDFLDRADELLRLKAQGTAGSEEAFRDVFNAISELRSVHSKAYLDLDNIEVLFGAIELAQLIGKLGHRDHDQIDQLRNSIITLIFKTLEICIPFPIELGHINPPIPYGKFVKMLFDVQSQRTPTDPHYYSFITFNYDLCLDFALHYYYGQNYDYCLSGTIEPQKFPLLKLHGSINWSTCNQCDQIIPRNFNDVNFGPLFDFKYVNYNLGSELSKKEHCGEPIKGPPILVPPTWDKMSYHKELGNIWKIAAKELSEAENIFIVGYSLPETDLFFRYLFALGSESDTRIRRFWVINPDLEGGVEGRFRDLIGRGIEKRFVYLPFTFNNAISNIATALEQP